MSDHDPGDHDPGDHDPGTDPAEPDPAPRATPTPTSSGRGRVVAIVAVVAVVLLGLVAVLGTAGGDDEPDTSGQVLGDQAPELVGTTISGEQFALSDQQGRFTVVNFFATWCPPCVAEHPELVAFSERNADDATVVSVAFDEPAATIEDWFAANGGDWPVVADAGSIPIDWGVVKLPESFLVAPDGTVVEKVKGGVTAAGLEELIAEYEG